MESKVSFAAVGAFVLVLGTALIAAVLWLASGKLYRKAYDTYLVYTTESVSGLDPDAPVRYRGVQVGVVRRIALAQDDVERVQLTLGIERGTPVKQDTVAVLSVQGLTGIAHVELARGSRGAAPLAARPGEEYPVIASAPSFMMRLDASLTALVASVTMSSERLNVLLDERNRRALGDALANLQEVTRVLAARSAAIDAGVVNAARAMENTAALTARLPRLVERASVAAESVERMANEVERAGAMATATIEDTRSGTRRAAADTLPDAQALLSELRELTASLRRFSEQIERQPALLIHGRPAAKPGPGE
jgi:phospholipid/cholesterol/gamma-HCH transport system substrate-binding protein